MDAEVEALTPTRIPPLPGRYAVRERYGEYDRTVTFQTLDEVKEYLNWNELTAPPALAGGVGMSQR